MMYQTTNGQTGAGALGSGAIKPVHFDGVMRDNFAVNAPPGLEARGSGQDPFKYQGTSLQNSAGHVAEREWRKKPEFLMGPSSHPGSLNMTNNEQPGGLFPQINSNGFKCNQPSSGQHMSNTQVSQPASAHGATAQGGTMNALKHSGGHISGMSAHQLAGATASGGLNGALNERHRLEAGLNGPTINHAQIKPMSSPRSSQ